MASWTTPSTWVAGNVLTAAQLNQQLRDNMTFLSATASNTVATSETTASTTYAALATAGPAVTVTTGTHALVILTCQTQNSTVNRNDYMSFVVSGATTTASADTKAVVMNAYVANFPAQVSAAFFVTLTAGSNTFTAQYREDGAGTATFVNRSITVIPLP